VKTTDIPVALVPTIEDRPLTGRFGADSLLAAMKRPQKRSDDGHHRAPRPGRGDRGLSGRDHRRPCTPGALLRGNAAQGAHTELRRGELKRRLRALSRQKFRPPGSDRTRTYGVSTLQRWYYAYKKGGLDALRPKQRADRGHGRELSPELKELLLDIRREHRSVPATVIRDTLIAQGQMQPETASESTIQRLYREHGLSRLPRGVAPEDGAHRLRWEAPHPGALWHGDVCHGRAITIGGQKLPLRIHALMDDASRYVVALEAQHTERALSGSAAKKYSWGAKST
jgi:transposase